MITCTCKNPNITLEKVRGHLDREDHAVYMCAKCGLEYKAKAWKRAQITREKYGVITGKTKPKRRRSRLETRR